MKSKTIVIAFLAALFLGVMNAPAAAQTPPTSLWITLGTQAGPIANPNRSQPANLLAVGDAYFLIDAGDGAAEQLAKVNVPLRALSAVFLSHFHADHTGGLAAIISMRYQLGVAGRLKIYGPPGTRQLVDGITASLLPMSNIGSGMPQSRVEPSSTVEVFEIASGERLDVQGVTIRTIENTHYVAAAGGHDSTSLSLSFRFDAPDRSIVYTGDTGPSTAVENLARGADLLVAEMLDYDGTLANVRAALAGQPDARVVEIADFIRRSHLTPAEVGAMAQRAGVRAVVVTHMAPGSVAAADLARYRAELRAHYNGPVSFANDLDAF